MINVLIKAVVVLVKF